MEDATEETSTARREREADAREGVPVVVVAQGDPSQWTRDEAWDLYWEKVLYAAE